MAGVLGCGWSHGRLAARRAGEASAEALHARTTGRVELRDAGDQGFSFGSADSRSGSVTTRPVSATLEQRVLSAPDFSSGPIVSSEAANTWSDACSDSARCETATDGVEMPVTRAKRVLPTPLGGGLSLPRKGAIKRDRWSSSEPALCGWACASARSSGSVVKLLLLQRAPHAHRPAPSAGITPGQPGPHTIAHPHPSPRSKPRPHPTGHPSLAHQA